MNKKEIAGLGVIAALFIYALWPVLSLERIVSHDTLWFYGVFQYFAESLSRGVFPYWDPFDYSGQPFYPNISIMQMLNPITVLLIAVNRLAGMVFFQLYHWHVVLEILFCGFGVYLFSREITSRGGVRLIVFFTFLFSSFTYIVLRQAGFLYSFLWAPYLMYFAVRFMKKPGWGNSLGVGFMAGMAMNGYQGLYLIVYAGLLIPLFIVTSKEALRTVFKKQNLKFALLMLSVAGILSLPLFSVFTEKDDYIPMARIKTSPVKTDSFTNRTGSVPAQIDDFKGFYNRGIAVKGYFDKKMPLSEGFMHIGWMGLIFALIGLTAGKGRFKTAFVINTVFIFLLMLGGRTVVQDAVNFIFPPFRFVRHMQLFAPYFLFNVIYFAIIGYEKAFSYFEKKRSSAVLYACVSAMVVLDLMSYGKAALPYVTLPGGSVDVKALSSGRLEFVQRRQPSFSSSDQIRYFKPLIYKTHTAFNAASVPPDFSPEGFKYGLYTLYNMTRSRDPLINVQWYSMNVKDAVDNGLSGLDSMSREEKLVFLGVLNAVTVDMARYADFYSLADPGFDKIKGLRLWILRSYIQTAKGGSPVPASGVGQAFDDIFDLRGVSAPVKRQGTFVFMDKPYPFKERCSAHAMLFRGMPLTEYIELLWGGSHVEEFTLLMKKDYERFMMLPFNAKDKADKVEINKWMYSAAGISADIIRFYREVTAVAPGASEDSILSGDARNGLLIERDRGPYGPDGTSGPVDFEYQVTGYGENGISLDYRSSAKGYLYYSDTYDRHWRCFVDNKETGIYRANLVFKSIEAPEGSHHVVFLYQPKLFILSLIAYYLTVIAAAAYAAQTGLLRVLPRRRIRG